MLSVAQRFLDPRHTIFSRRSPMSSDSPSRASRSTSSEILSSTRLGCARITAVDLEASPGDALAVAQRTFADIVGTAALLEHLTLRLEDGSESAAPAGKTASAGRKLAEHREDTDP